MHTRAAKPSTSKLARIVKLDSLVSNRLDKSYTLVVPENVERMKSLFHVISAAGYVNHGVYFHGNTGVLHKQYIYQAHNEAIDEIHTIDFAGIRIRSQWNFWFYLYDFIGAAVFLKGGDRLGGSRILCPLLSHINTIRNRYYCIFSHERLG